MQWIAEPKTGPEYDREICTLITAKLLISKTCKIVILWDLILIDEKRFVTWLMWQDFTDFPRASVSMGLYFNIIRDYHCQILTCFKYNGMSN